jgi:hypothetical protein
MDLRIPREGADVKMHHLDEFRRRQVVVLAELVQERERAPEAAPGGTHGMLGGLAPALQLRCSFHPDMLLLWHFLCTI